MESFGAERPHAVCLPFPGQGHINPMLKVAKLLHSAGFYITFVNTQFNHNRLLKSRGPCSLDGLDDFRFATIPDGLPPSNPNATQDIPALCDSTSKHCLLPFRHLLAKLNRTDGMPRVSCIVADGAMSFSLQVAEELGVPEVLFWTTSACGFLAYLHYGQLKERGLTPLKDKSYLTNGYLETQIDWIPGMEGIRLRDLPNFVQTLDRDDIMLNFVVSETSRAPKASAVILNTFEDLEHDVLVAMRSLIPNTFSIGHLSFLCNQLSSGSPLSFIESNLWTEDTSCLEWLDSKTPGSVVYVNYGSITVLSMEQMMEFAWGLANSNHPFLWIIRPNLVEGESALLTEEFVEATRGRGMLASWCPQERVLSHPSVGVFLTHCGWNSTLESICSGVPMICWPFFAEQQTNCRYACTEWGIGMEIDSKVNRGGVEGLVREVMEGKKGKLMKKKALEWKEKAENAAKFGGSSRVNFDKLVKEVLRG